MKFVFFGTPEFAAIILEQLINNCFIPEAVVCNPDRPVGRKKIIATPPTKLLAQKYNIPVLQPEVLTNYKLQTTNYKPEFFIVASYSKIISEEILKIPRFGSIGIHPSLLPKYRGPSPIQSAILNGDEITGTTLFLMDEKVDHGSILAQRELELQTINYKLLSVKLAELSADLLIEILPNIEDKIKNAKPQNDFDATYTKKFTTENAFIESADLEKAQKEGGEIAEKIDRKIRAFNPEPGAWTIINNKRTKLIEAKITQDGKLKLKKIQAEGKKPIFINNSFAF